MSSLIQRVTSSGTVERYGASDKLERATTGHIEERARYAADLLLASLTETPHTPIIDGVRYEVVVSNRYNGNGVEEGAEDVTDTVDEARLALAEFVTARVAGTDPVELRRYKTEYKKIYKALAPNSRGERGYSSSFEEAFVESARGRGIDLPSPEVGRRIILSAPRSLLALPLKGHNYGYLADDRQVSDAVTEDGRIVKTISYNKYSFKPTYHYLEKHPSSLRTDRIGTAPGSTIVSQIEDRVVYLRTQSSKA